MKSFITVTKDSQFPIQNIPFTVFKPVNSSEQRVGIAIGDYILDLSILDTSGLLIYDSSERNIFGKPSLNAFMSLGSKKCSDIRHQIQKLLKEGNPVLRDNNELRNKSFHKTADVTLCMPVEIGDYTDFYSSKKK